MLTGYFDNILSWFTSTYTFVLFGKRSMLLDGDKEMVDDDDDDNE